jgi:hypothetical protein
MNALIAQLKYRSKAVVVAVAAILSAAAYQALQDPKVQAAVVHLVAPQYQSIAILIIGAIVTAIVHEIPRGEKPTPKSSEAPVTELAESPSTTMIPTINNNH